MKRFNPGLLLPLLLLGWTSVAAAQSGNLEPHTASQVFDAWVAKVEALVVPAATAMPGSGFSYAPSSGEFRGVRTFAEQIKHLAAANYQLAAAALGESPPPGTHDEIAPESVRTRADVLAYLKGSFAILHRAASQIREDNLNAVVTLRGRPHARTDLLIDALTHSMNHYGQMVEYLRLNGIVPPASR